MSKREVNNDGNEDLVESCTERQERKMWKCDTLQVHVEHAGGDQVLRR
jgi:hypothetical protein